MRLARIAVIACLALGCGIGRPRTGVAAPQSTSRLGRTLEQSVDRDGDGFVLENDRCPCEAEDVDGFEDQDGCPEPDNDHDGIVDVCDVCPNDAETYNGHCDGDGCPDHGHLCLSTSEIRILEEIRFARGQATLDAESLPIVDAIAAGLSGNPQITLVAIVGETHGAERRVSGLALARADAVRDALVARDVAADRLVTEADPAPQHTASEPPAAWRRVRFVVRELDHEELDTGTGLGADTGCGAPDPDCDVHVCMPPPPTPPAC